MPGQIQNTEHEFYTLDFLLRRPELTEHIVYCYLKTFSAPEKNYNKFSTPECNALFLALEYLFLLHIIGYINKSLSSY